MDTSETYVKMCERVSEVQALVPKDQHGDDLPHQFFAGELGIWSEDDGYYYGGGSTCTWLPRQDQLQEMAIPDDERDAVNKYAVLLDDFQAYVLDEHPTLAWSHAKAVDKPISMEQFWLCFVMHEKYQKRWNGEDWVKEG